MQQVTNYNSISYMKSISVFPIVICQILVLTFYPVIRLSSQPYQPSWESLARHTEAPEWFKDAKLGIYFHWGVYSVPAFGNEWYPRNMYFKGSREYNHHVEKYGDPSVFNYHDFVPLFKAEKFDAGDWADLFLKAGARFAGPVAEHHDGYAMWASKITPWNVLKTGPHRDITGELQKAITARGMKFITTFHHDRHVQRYSDQPDEKKFNDSHYPLVPGTATVSKDKKLRYLYGNIPVPEWEEKIWFGKLKEVIDHYQPDIIWFDSWLDRISEEKRMKFCAYYLNAAKKQNKEVVIVRKQNDLPLEVSVDDMEKSRKNKTEPAAWMTDETISTGSWCYTENLQIKPAADLLHVLIDIVSKNGVLLLNISPMADGTIPENQRKVLLEMGNWLAKYGEAIYNTRPWITFGEGPTKEPEGGFEKRQEFARVKYSAGDIRYTTKPGVVYAIIMGKADNANPLVLRSFAVTGTGKAAGIDSVTLLGSSKPVRWKMTPEGLNVQAGFDQTDEMAMVFRIGLKNVN